ncbi:hypothetical protein KSP39_PZI014275 [Platanthera zijinensis]|uniref:Uncharacterized protein n=1 Tax=Platanthera zijinensis TaxID=2320716 RepID=A0AAP0BAG1_9ASPA
MMPYVKEAVEVAVCRFIELGNTKEGVVDIPFINLFLELKKRVVTIDQAAKDEAEVDEEDEDEENKVEIEDELDATQNEVQKIIVEGSSHAGHESKSSEFASKSSSLDTDILSEYADSESDGDGNTSGGYSLDDQPSSPTPTTKKLKPLD